MPSKLFTINSSEKANLKFYTLRGGKASTLLVYHSGAPIPHESVVAGVEELGASLPDHVDGGRLPEDGLHHGQVFPIVVRLEQRVALQMV